MFRKNNRIYLLSVLVLISTMVVGVRYAILSDRINVNGIATSYIYYPGTDLPLEFQPVSGSDYFSYSAERSCVSYESTDINNSNITVKYSKSWCFFSSATITYTIKMKNTTEMPWTLGTAAAEITNNGMSYVKNTSAALDKTTVLPGEIATMTLTIETNFTAGLGTQTVKGTYSYMFLNKRRNAYFTFSYE